MLYINIWSRLHSSMAQNEANIEFYWALLFVKSRVKSAFRTKVSMYRVHTGKFV